MNAHVIDYLYHEAESAASMHAWLAYEFYRQWHEDELTNPVYPVI